MISGTKSFYLSGLTPNHHDIDPAMLERLHEGADSAFTFIYKAYHQRLYFFAKRYVEEADAMDVVSDAFAALWRKRSDMESGAAVTQFLFVTVRNRCLDVVRRAAVREHRQREILHLLQTSEETELFKEDLTTELVQLIYAEIEKLPPRMREIFLLSFAEGLKPSAIAERLQLNIQTVKNQKLTAIRLLQAALGPRSIYLSLLLLLSEGSSPTATA